VLLRQVLIGRRNLVSRSCLDFSVCLDRQRRWGLQRCSGPTHTSGELTLPVYSHFQRTHTSGVLARLVWARCSHGVRHARRGLFAALLTHLAWARCSPSIHHARRGLFTALLTHLAWACCPRGVVVAAPVMGIER